MRTLSLFGLALAACIAQAEAPAALEYTLGIAGELVIDPQGRVTSWKMDDGLAPVLAQLVQRNVDQWRFEPIPAGDRAGSGHCAQVLEENGNRLQPVAIAVDDGMLEQGPNACRAAFHVNAPLVDRPDRRLHCEPE